MHFLYGNDAQVVHGFHAFYRRFGTILIFVGIFTLASIVSPTFLTEGNLTNVLRQVVEDRELTRFCADVLADFKVPEAFHRLENTLPRNANGKVLKRDLRQSLVA